MLEHLRNYHAIFTESIYNDLHGFIRNQDIHGDAYTEFYRGFACQEKGDEATTSESKREEYEKSIKHYTKAIELKPDIASTYTNRGNTYEKISDFDQAIIDHSQAIQLNPDYAEAYNNRGIAYMKKGDLDQAIRNYNQAIQLNPDYAEAYNNRGVAFEKKSDFDQAIQDYTKAIQLKPDYANAYLNRSGIWLRLQEWEKAKADLTKARDLGIDIIAKFQSVFGSIANFELINDTQLPEDLAEMLTPPQP